eukprot:Trichotokara_eunicae@DN4498_c0_g1_i2.p1
MLDQASLCSHFGMYRSWRFSDDPDPAQFTEKHYIPWSFLGTMALDRARNLLLAHRKREIVGFIGNPHPLRNDAWMFHAFDPKKKFHLAHGHKWQSRGIAKDKEFGHRLVVYPTDPFALKTWRSHYTDSPMKPMMVKRFIRLLAIHLWEKGQTIRDPPPKELLLSYVANNNPVPLNFAARKGCTATCYNMLHLDY